MIFKDQTMYWSRSLAKTTSVLSLYYVVFLFLGNIMANPEEFQRFFTPSGVLITNLDYLEILGLDDGFSDSDLKKAYKKLAIKFHPDRNPENVEKAQLVFQLISNANDVLGDPSQRGDYLALRQTRQTRQTEGQRPNPEQYSTRPPRRATEQEQREARQKVVAAKVEQEHILRPILEKAMKSGDPLARSKALYDILRPIVLMNLRVSYGLDIEARQECLRSIMSELYPDRVQELQTYMNNINSSLSSYDFDQMVQQVKENTFYIDAMMQDNRSLLDKLIEYKRFDLALELIKKGADWKLKDWQGNTILNRAVKDPEFFKTLLTVLPKDELLEVIKGSCLGHGGGSDKTTLLQFSSMYPDTYKAILDWLPTEERDRIHMSNFYSQVLYDVIDPNFLMELYHRLPTFIRSAEDISLFMSAFLSKGLTQSLEPIRAIYKDR